MKKIILIFIILLCSGCFDYKELNNLGIISGIGIDYHDNNYYITYEVINTKKNKEEETTKSYIVEGYGNTLDIALSNTNKSLAKEPYYSHLKIIVISPNVDILSISDKILRSDNISTNFYLVINDNPKDILDYKSLNEPINSVAILNLLENINYVKLDNSFDYIVSNIMDNKINIVIPKVSIQDELSLDGYSIYNNKYLKDLDNKEINIYNYLTSNKKILVRDKDNNSIYITDGKYKFNIDKDNITIDFNATGIVSSLNDNLNFRNKDSYTILEDNFNNIIKEDIIEFINNLNKDNIDILGIYKAYYLKYGYINKNININVNTNILINKSGVIFEVIK